MGNSSPTESEILFFSKTCGLGTASANASGVVMMIGLAFKL
jgi:hypothetical protein